jgi:FMN phosphatase YigB (HAD superfamily)
VERKNSKRKIVLVDIDGTLADVSHRLQFARGPHKDWGRFFAAMDRDQPINAVIDFVMRLAGKYDIVIFTGRPEDYCEKTMNWLRR